MWHRSTYLLGVLAILSVINMAMFAKYNAMPKTVFANAGQETCPEGEGWVKVDGLSSQSFTYTAPSSKLISASCYKAGTTVNYQSYIPPKSSVTINSTVWNKPACPNDNGCNYQNLSHASFLLINEVCQGVSSCPNECRTQNVTIQGNCGDIICPANAPQVGTCPSNCGYSGGDVVPDGNCEQKTCPATVACPVNCQWSAWSSCSAECGGGIQTRTHIVEAENGGLACTGNSQQVCNTQECSTPINCEWSAWSSCSTTCGGGIQTRTHTVEASNGGAVCEGPSEQNCNEMSCSTIRWCHYFNNEGYEAISIPANDTSHDSHEMDKPWETGMDRNCVKPSPTASPNPSASPEPSVSPTATPTPAPSTKKDFYSEAWCDGHITLHFYFEGADNTKKVKFSYNNESKETTTDNSGKARIDFGYAGEKEAKVEFDGDSMTTNVKAAENCASGSVLGTSTHSGIGGGQILGASTMAGTGVFTDVMMIVLGVTGSIMTFVGARRYGKKNK